MCSEWFQHTFSSFLSFSSAHLQKVQKQKISAVTQRCKASRIPAKSVLRQEGQDEIGQSTTCKCNAPKWIPGCMVLPVPGALIQSSTCFIGKLLQSTRWVSRNNNELHCKYSFDFKEVVTPCSQTPVRQRYSLLI